ncbi:MAG: hypothetical protein KDK60_03640, partial [Chlamydiia bacterium]|nr:hypothetical protein [Chlamydiia bacterium]
NRSLLRAKNVTFRFFDAPILYLPSFKSNLRVFTESPVRYRVDWDKGLWPKISMRYRLYSWENLDLYFRINVRPSKGVGGALETDYRSPTKRATFRTRSYLDHDAFYRDTNPDKAHTHYRLEGRYDASSEDGRSTFLATYDWLSDKNLQTDFRSEDFELRTAKQTRIAFRNRQDWMRYGLDGKFRVNGFQGMMQELPFTFWAPKPITLGESGITFENRLTGGYLDYVSARKIEPLVPDFSAVRLSSQHTLYRPFFRRGIAFTPYLGVEGVFYSDSQQSRAEFLGVLTYGARLEGTMQREFKTLRHIFIPYIRYEGMTHPTISPDTPYVFSIQDGFNRLNLVQPGVRNLFFLRGSSLYHPNIIFDLSAYSFFGDNTFLKTVPKLQGELNWNFPTWTLSSKLGWNFEKALLDYANVGLAWTINEHFAFKTEFRHRSRYDWRKNQPHNYIMEITRDLSDLLNSPLSDGRNTLLSRLQVKIAPQWIARIESHIGWGRGGEPNYNEVKLDLITIISTSWRLRLTFIHSPAPHKKNDRFTFGISLVRN